jgi:hypothetical protein
LALCVCLYVWWPTHGPYIGCCCYPTMQEMKDEVSFKEKQLETSQMTMARLVEEKNRRVQVG